MTKTNELPSRGTLLKIAKEIPSKPEWETPQEARDAERAANERRSMLMKDARLKSLEKSAARIRKKHRAANLKWNTARRKLFQRIQLEPITPALVAEVRKMLGLKKS